MRKIALILVVVIVFISLGGCCQGTWFPKDNSSPNTTYWDEYGKTKVDWRGRPKSMERDPRYQEW